MLNKDLFLAIDVGTTNIKVAVFTSEGKLLNLSKQRYTNAMDYGKVDPQSWWNATKKALFDLPYEQRRRIVALSITGQGPTIVPVDKNGRIVHKVISWFDTLGQEYVQSISKIGVDELTASTLAKIIWLDNILKDEVYLLQPNDYICFKLTNRIVNMSFNTYGFRPVWCEDSIFQNLNLTGHFLKAEFVPTGNEIAKVKPDIALELGFSQNVSVVAGAPDFAAALVGTGTVEDGYLCDRGGTSQGVNLCTSEKVYCDGLLTTPFFIDGLWKVSGIMNTTGKAIDWFCSKISNCEDLLTSNIDELKKVERPTNLIFLPYLKGERSPIWDLNAKGVFFGLDLETDKRKLLVSIMEGIAYGMATIIQRMEKAGCSIKMVRTTGGQAKNHLWNQIKADVLGKEIEVPLVSESELLGTSIFAMSFIYGEAIEKICKKIVKIGSIFIPDNEKYNRYKKLIELYEELYHRNKDLFKII